mgnify:FL=1
MRKILSLAALITSMACGDTYNNYPVSGGNNGENGEKLDCEGAISRQVFECGYNPKGGDLQKEYTVGVRECKSVPFPEEYKICIANSDCNEIRAGKCDSLIPDY